MTTSARSGAKEPRFAQLTLEELDPERAAIARPLVERLGGIGGPFDFFALGPAHAPLPRSRQLSSLLHALPRRLVEMAVLMRARYSTEQVEWRHSHGARGGACRAICAALKDGKRPETWRPTKQRCSISARRFCATMP